MTVWTCKFMLNLNIYLFLRYILTLSFHLLSLSYSTKAQFFLSNRTDYRSKVSGGKIPFKGRHCRLLIDVKEFIYLVEVKTITVSLSLRTVKWYVRMIGGVSFVWWSHRLWRRTRGVTGPATAPDSTPTTESTDTALRQRQLLQRRGKKHSSITLKQSCALTCISPLPENNILLSTFSGTV